MKRIPFFTIALVVSAATVGQAQTRMTVKPDSKVTLTGSSNVHGWACRSSVFQASVEVDPQFPTSPLTAVTHPIGKVSVNIPVRSLDCGHGKMNENMYKALDSEKYPDIVYVLTSYELTKDSVTADSFVANTVGQLTVAGKAIRVEIPIKAQRMAGGATIGEGSVKLLMTDFGIKPPVAIFGTLRTRNEIEISFKVQLDRAVAVALMQK